MPKHRKMPMLDIMDSIEDGENTWFVVKRKFWQSEGFTSIELTLQSGEQLEFEGAQTAKMIKGLRKSKKRKL